jgi:hypothetical protein
MNCKECKEDKPCHGCEHDRRAKVDVGGKIQEIIEKHSAFNGEAYILYPEDMESLVKELSKPTENKDTEIQKLQHHKDSTVGLWCTDKPDAIPEDKKHLFFRISY